MPNALIINGHQPYPSSPGRLNEAFVELATDVLQRRSFDIRTVASASSWDTEEEIANQLWADFILLQFPLNSMSVPWSLKRYLDVVYTAGMDGRLARGDGRTRSDPARQYGSGGLMGSRSYGLSVTLNAPVSAFSDPAQTLFAGRSLDDLLAPIHINFAFFGLTAQPTFAAYDVAKAPQIEIDFTRFKSHMDGLEL